MTLRLGTLNVWGLPWPLSRCPSQRMHAIGDRLSELDLDAIACQEVWTASGRGILVDAAARAGLTHAWHRESTLGGSGLLLLSRWPIREAYFHRFRLSGLPQRFLHLDYYGGKGFASTVLDTPDGELQLVNTHLNAAYGRQGFKDEYFGHRVAQVLELSSAIASSPRPVALLGDLNAHEEGEEMQILRELTGLRDAAVDLDRRHDTVVGGSAFRSKGHPGSRLDYTLFRSGESRGLRAVDFESAFGDQFEIDGDVATFSDHIGAIATLELHRGGAALPAPGAAAVARAREILAHGRDTAEERRGDQRAVAAVAGGIALAAATARSRHSRRDWLRTGMTLAAGIALAPSLAFAGLAEGFTPGELDRYDESEGLLQLFTALARQRGVQTG